MKPKTKKKILQWHPAFCSATELELREDRDSLEFEREHQLSSSPLKIDMMVIKKKPGVKLKNEIGHLFMAHNIIEYKSPSDRFNIDNYYKSVAYVCPYKSQGHHVNEIPAEELTLSLFHDSKPVKLIELLQERGLRVIEKYSGIYYIEGDLLVPRQQIVVTSEFDGSHYFLKALSKSFTLEDGIELASIAQEAKDEGDRQNLDSVLQVSFIANNPIYSRMKKENTMCEAFFELFKDEVAAKIAAAEDLIRKETEERVRAETEERVRNETERRVRQENKAEVFALKREIEELKKKLSN